MSYCTKGDIQNYLMVDIDSSFDTQIGYWITAVENYINKFTNNPDGFESSLSETRYFDGNGKTEIDVNEFLSLSAIEILELNGSDVEWTLIEGIDNDFIIYPYNVSPKFRLIIVPTATIGAWYLGKKRIKLTGIWGNSSSVPKEIELAATMLVSQVVEKGLKGGTVKSESLGDYSVTYANIDEIAKNMGVKDILAGHKKYIL